MPTPSWNHAECDPIVFQGDELSLLRALMRDAEENKRWPFVCPPATCNYHLGLLYEKLGGDSDDLYDIREALGGQDE